MALILVIYNSTSLRLTPPTLEMWFNLYKEMFLRVLDTFIFLEYLEEGVPWNLGKARRKARRTMGP
jgi:hypothetical protein